jgi:DNA polymerase V
MIAIADCNSFYASCEKVFRPDLIGKPIVVLSNNDGCIVSRTDEAKKLGIDMAAPYFQNKDVILANGVEVFSSNYHLYGDMSQRVMSIFKTKMGDDDLVEVYSVDEAFLDFKKVPENEYYKKALDIKRYTEQCTGIPICIGVGPNKLLSKVANKLAKKDKIRTEGIYVLADDESIANSLQHFPVGDLWGIGSRYTHKLLQLGINTALKLRNMPLEWAKKNLGGIVGERLIRQLRGEDISIFVEPLVEKKMIATTRMFGKNVTDLKEIEEAISTYTLRAAEKLRRQYSATGCIQIFLMYRDMDSKDYTVKSTGSFFNLPYATSNSIELAAIAVKLARQCFFKGRIYKKGGVMLSKIVNDNSLQGNLFNPEMSLNRNLMAAIDNINAALGPDTITLVSAGKSKIWKMRQELRSPKYTTSWDEMPSAK